MMRMLVRLPAFWVGLALRVALVVAVAALAHAPGADELHRLLGFPAGFALGLPAQGLVELTQALGLGTRAGLLLLVLLADVAMLLGLRVATELETPALLRWYWLSPFVLGIAYGLTGLELAGAAWLCWAFAFVRRDRPQLAAVACALAVATHAAALLALPLFAIYWFRNRPLRSRLKPFGVAFGVATVAVACVGVLTWPGDDVAGSAWLHALRSLVVSAGNARLELFPLAHVLAMFLAWRLRRISC